MPPIVWPQVWSSGKRGPECGPENLVDGETNTCWIGNATGAPWRVAVDYGQTVGIEGVDILFRDEPWTNIGIAGSSNVVEWYNAMPLTHTGAPLRYLYINMWEDRSRTSPPALREIMLKPAAPSR